MAHLGYLNYTQYRVTVGFEHLNQPIKDMNFTVSVPCSQRPASVPPMLGGLMDSDDDKCHQEQLQALNVPEPGPLWNGRIPKAQRT